MTTPGGGVIITLEAIYNQLIALAARVDTALSRHERTEQLVAEHNQELRPLAGAADRLTDHEARLRALEKSRWPIASITVLVGLGSLAATILIAIYGK